MYEAMAVLGYGTLYNPREALRRNLFPYIGSMLRNKHESQGPLWPPPIERFESMWGDFRAISGDVVWPFAEEVIALYPEAKIVLTVRDDEEKWFASAFNTSWYNRIHVLARILPALDPHWQRMSEFTTALWTYCYGNDFPTNGLRVYREHNAMVKRLGGDRVLVFNPKDEWGPLCEHLGKPVPNVPYPHVNKRDENRFLFHTLRQEGLRRLVKRLVATGGLTGIVLALIWWRRTRIASLLQSLRAMLIS